MLQYLLFLFVLNINVHPFGTSSINQTIFITVLKNRIEIKYFVDMAETITALKTPGIDEDHDGNIDDEEKKKFALSEYDKLLKKLKINLNGKLIKKPPDTYTLTFPPGNDGLPILYLTYYIGIDVPDFSSLKYLKIENDNFKDKKGIKKIVFLPERSIQNRVKYKISGQKPVAGYPQNYSILILFNGYNGEVNNPSESLSKSVKKEKKKNVSSEATKKSFASSNLNTTLYNSLKKKNKSFWMVLFILFVAFLSGGAHSLSPGHGKSIAAAFLLGRRANIFHALLFALSITFAHVFSVIVLGILTFTLKNVFFTEKIGIVLQIVSGILVAIIGVYQLISRIKALKNPSLDHHDHHHHHPHSHPHSHHHSSDKDSHSHTHDDHHHPNHDDDSAPSIKEILSLGISGGLTPCVTAIAIFLVALGMGEVTLGILIILFFSLGIASVLFLINILVIYGGNKFLKMRFDEKIYRYISVVSAVVIIIVGVALFTNAFLNSGSLFLK